MPTYIPCYKESFLKKKKQSKTRMNEKKLLPLQDALHHFIYIFPCSTSSVTPHNKGAC